jgi:hypothetical protein
MAVSASTTARTRLAAAAAPSAPSQRDQPARAFALDRRPPARDLARHSSTTGSGPWAGYRVSPACGARLLNERDEDEAEDQESEGP